MKHYKLSGYVKLQREDKEVMFKLADAMIWEKSPEVCKVVLSSGSTIELTREEFDFLLGHSTAPNME